MTAAAHAARETVSSPCSRAFVSRMPTERSSFTSTQLD
ncbi:hypothetical protein RAM_10520 [Amycolatopsis mediterranei S699]|uniref:Uncharacterized protein n=1 Tax=Amycolatopsis mediterranei (strain S699) TaxID=713604 RepID=A0A9R0NTY5_AMYMS|nr:hypothetical protein RAM_10520 [Amycolatopsis mediterranei S699]